MSVGQRSDGRWLVKYKAGGEWKQKSFKDEMTARAFDTEQCAEDKDSRPTLIELAASFFRSHPDYHPETRRKIIHFVNGYINATGKEVDGIGQFLRDKYAEDLTRADLEMMREVMRQRGSGNATINKMQAYIRAILAWGVDQQLIRLNPWRDYKRLPAKKMEITATLDDFQHILQFCPDWLRWALATAYALAMRPGHVELFSLTWAAFNWRHGYVQYAQGKSGRVKRVIPPPAYWVAHVTPGGQKRAADLLPSLVQFGAEKSPHD